MDRMELHNIGLKDKLVGVIENKIFTESITGKSFQHFQFKNTGAKRITFKDCNFHYCFFERAYFHCCQFVNCKFIGARFVDCNFRGASFDSCDFEYATFKSTLIDGHELLKNLSARPNVRRELLLTLRLNAESIGDAKSVKIFVREELAASREHLKKARQAKEEYYASKYSSLPKRIQVYGESLKVWLDWNLWGHGEYPWRILRTVIIGLVLASGFRIVESGVITDSLPIGKAISTIISHFMDVTKTFVGIVPNDFPSGLAAILSLFRYIVLGLFISVLYRRLSKR